MAQLAAVRAGNRLFASRVDLHQQQHIGLAEHLHKIVIQIAGAAVAVRLVDHHQTTLRPAATHGLDHCGHFTRVMAIVVDQHHAATVHRQFAVDLEAPTDTLEARQPGDDGGIVDAFVGGDGDGRQGIEDVVVTRHVHRHVERLAVRAQHGEVSAHALLTHVDRAHVGILGKAVGHGWAANLRQQFAHHRIIHAEHGQAVERQVMEELNEGLLQPIEVAAIGAHVVGVDIGDHRNHRLQVQEAGVALIGFGDQEAAGTELGIGTGSVQAATDDEGRIKPASGEHRGQQAGGGGLAMGAGHGDAVTVAHQLGEHLGTRHHRNPPLQRGSDFRVAGVDGAGNHQYISLLGVLRTVPDENGRPEVFQALGHGRCLEVGTGHFVTQVEQHLGDAAHAHAADTDEVNTADTAHAPHFGLDRSRRLSHASPPGRCRPPCGWHQAWPGDARWRP